MKKGICKLCRLDRELVRSHLIPAALFDYLRAEGMSPLRIGDGIVTPTDRQAQDYLLCSVCEDVLNKGGESWVTTKLATTAHSFPLYDLLTSQPAASDDGEDAVYFTANNPLFNSDALTHLAIGIFWKASGHSWRRNKAEPMIELGPYEDELRRWLLGEIDFPDRICLVVELSKPTRALVTLNPPFEKCREGWRTFFMHLLGASFTLEVGARIDPGEEILFLQKRRASRSCVGGTHCGNGASSCEALQDAEADARVPAGQGETWPPQVVPSQKNMVCLRITHPVTTILAMSKSLALAVLLYMYAIPFGERKGIT